ncbi:transcriptional regulation of mitochondrial recombination-domain-containing protein [Bombardia bombarda]|uniref:Large ribosomal subunit protein mL67 n=1 Tax=Bombardia bombarda TaxID=252184 RepID=A0AA39X9E0_9PEZI|nr:transcriptional regulation of mitochondrial recombination-domain-containing protein [Bombardia bombarda]
MNPLYTTAKVATATSQICRLALGVSRISIRQATHKTTASGVGPRTRPPRLLKKTIPNPPRPNLPGSHPAGHGQEIWIWNNIENGMVLLSHTPQIRSHKAIGQLAYTGKKLIPAKVRKDYWRQMACVRFSPGLGDVGRGVFTKLREFRKRHELEWGPEHSDETTRLLRMSKRERGEAINDQKANTIADIAAVLAGAGKGSKMFIEGPKSKAAPAAAAAAKGKSETKLHRAMIFWADQRDRLNARAWSYNVTHVAGLPQDLSEAELAAAKALVAAEEKAEAEAEAETAAAAARAAAEAARAIAEKPVAEAK